MTVTAQLDQAAQAGPQGQDGGQPRPLAYARVQAAFPQLLRAREYHYADPGSGLGQLSAGFFGQVGISASTSPGQAASFLEAAADKMLNALVFHSDHLELSEQFDKATGFEKSVRGLTWSYSSFLAAVRANTGQSVLG